MTSLFVTQNYGELLSGKLLQRILQGVASELIRLSLNQLLFDAAEFSVQGLQSKLQAVGRAY